MVGRFRRRRSSFRCAVVVVALEYPSKRRMIALSAVENGAEQFLDTTGEIATALRSSSVDVLSIRRRGRMHRTDAQPPDIDHAKNGRHVDENIVVLLQGGLEHLVELRRVQDVRTMGGLDAGCSGRKSSCNWRR